MSYFYETPRLPMFMVMEDANIVRVRALRYLDGKLDGVLADWDVDNVGTDFYEKDNWDSKYEFPFYCLYKNEKGELMQGYRSVRRWAEVTTENDVAVMKLYKRFVENARILNVPVFNSIEEARNYVFGKKSL